MKNLINENDKLIKKFDFNYYFSRKNYQMASAIKALSVTNDIQIDILWFHITQLIIIIVTKSQSHSNFT